MHNIRYDTKQLMFSLQRMAAILDIWVKMMFKRKSDVRIGILVVDLVEKVYLYLILGALVQKLIFQDGAGGHLGYFGQNDVLASN